MIASALIADWELCLCTAP